MKKLGTLALTLTLTGAMALPALAAEEPELVIAPADTGYGQTIVLNGETLDLTGIPGVSGEELLPLRLLAEADHGSAYWDEENNESWFTFGDNRITVKFADNSVWLDDQQVKSTAQVADGITFVEAGVLSMLEGYTVDRNPELDVNRIDITTPNNDPMVKTAYQIREESGMAFGMRSDNAEVATLFQLPEDTFEQAICFTSMNTTPDIMVLAKLADGADETAVKEALEAHRQSQHDTFSWYLAQNLPKVEDARILVEDVLPHRRERRRRRGRLPRLCGGPGLTCPSITSAPPAGGALVFWPAGPYNVAQRRNRLWNLPLPRLRFRPWKPFRTPTAGSWTRFRRPAGPAWGRPSASSSARTAIPSWAVWWTPSLKSCPSMWRH